MKRILAIAAASGMLAFGAAPAAHAGEVTGSGEQTPIKAGTKSGKIPPASHCAYSGLDDVDEGEDVNIPESDDFGRTQNYGQIIKMIGPVSGEFTPANSGCNKNAAPPQEPQE